MIDREVYWKLQYKIYKIDVMFDLAQNSPPKVKIPTLTIIVDQQYEPQNKTHPFGVLQVPTTQLANTNIDLKFVELTAGVLENIIIKGAP